MGEGGAKFVGFEEMIGVARAAGEGKLASGESFVDEDAAGAEGALDGGKEGALEVAEAKNDFERSGGQREGFEVGFEEEKMGGGGGIGSRSNDAFLRVGGIP